MRIIGFFNFLHFSTTIEDCSAFSRLFSIQLDHSTDGRIKYYKSYLMHSCIFQLFVHLFTFFLVLLQLYLLSNFVCVWVCMCFALLVLSDGPAHTCFSLSTWAYTWVSTRLRLAWLLFWFVAPQSMLHCFAFVAWQGTVATVASSNHWECNATILFIFTFLIFWIFKSKENKHLSLFKISQRKKLWASKSNNFFEILLSFFRSIQFFCF